MSVWYHTNTLKIISETLSIKSTPKFNLSNSGDVILGNIFSKRYVYNGQHCMTLNADQWRPLDKVYLSHPDVSQNCLISRKNYAPTSLRSWPVTSLVSSSLPEVERL